MPPSVFPSQKPWLLDHNVPAALAAWLDQLGIQCVTVADRNWHELSDAKLVRAAEEEFEVLLTRDRAFAISAADTLTNSQLAVVLVRLPQAPFRQFLGAFAEEWQKQLPRTQPGKCLEWPEQFKDK